MSRRVPQVRTRPVKLACWGAVLAGSLAGCQTSGAPTSVFPSPSGAGAPGAPAGLQLGGPPTSLFGSPAPGAQAQADAGSQPAQAPGAFGPAPGDLGDGPQHFARSQPVDDSLLPKELNKVTMPPYMVEAPDLLLIDSSRLIPLPPYSVQPLDTLFLNVPETYSDKAPEQVINGPYTVDPDGTINLGPNYGGPLRVADLTTPEIEKLVVARLKNFLKAANPAVQVSLAQARGAQQIRGEHLVQPDGTVSLGLYGSVYVAGMTTQQIKAAVEAHLARFLYKPEVSVVVSAYNSKFYYVITDFAGSGESVQRIPATGNESVLDAIAVIGGLSPVSSKRVWIARPAPKGVGDQILPVDWKGITRRGSTTTNYQILPGDRVFVMGAPLVKVAAGINRALAPAERVAGTALLFRSLDPNFINGGNRGGTTVVTTPAATTTTR